MMVLWFLWFSLFDIIFIFIFFHHYHYHYHYHFDFDFDFDDSLSYCAENGVFIITLSNYNVIIIIIIIFFFHSPYYNILSVFLWHTTNTRPLCFVYSFNHDDLLHRFLLLDSYHQPNTIPCCLWNKPPDRFYQYYYEQL